MPSHRIPTQAEYETREAQEFHRQLRELERASLAERKEAASDFLDALRERPELVGERIGWILNGSYGYGAMIAAKRVVKNPRMNRMAWLTQTIAALEWRCPQRLAIAAWKKLTAEQKSALDHEVWRAMTTTERD